MSGSSAASPSYPASGSTTQKVRIPLLSPGGLFYSPNAAGAASGYRSSSSSFSNSTQTINVPPPPTTTEQTPLPPPPAYSQAAATSQLLRNNGSPPTWTPPTATAEAVGDGCEPPQRKKAKLDTHALAEASKNLTQTLKQLSSEVITYVIHISTLLTGFKRLYEITTLSRNEEVKLFPFPN